MSIEALRTPDERFSRLPGYAFAPHYVDQLPGFEGLRMHYVDEGPQDASCTFLCLHGEPSWAYLYRKMIPLFTEAGCRVVAPDFFGFGRSDKPVKESDYTYHFHRNALKAFFDYMQLENVCVVCQDWGGILGLSLPMDYPKQITRLLVMNTGLPIGQAAGEGFEAWRDFVASNPAFNVVDLMKRAVPGISDEEAQAYGAPFPDPSYMAGARQFPQLVMTSPEMEGVETSKRAIDFFQNEWKGACFMAVGLQDPVLGEPAMRLLHSIIRNSSELFAMQEAGHFVQEQADLLVPKALEYFGI